MIEWKKNLENPITINKMLVIKRSFMDYLTGTPTNQFEYFIAKFKKPYDEEPNKYNKDYILIMKFNVPHPFWEEVKFHFEWCDLE